MAPSAYATQRRPRAAAASRAAELVGAPRVPAPCHGTGFAGNWSAVDVLDVTIMGHKPRPRRTSVSTP